MRGETGVDLLMEMKQSGMEIPFILMSGDTDSNEIKRAEYYGTTFTSLDKGIQPIVKCDGSLKVRFSTQ